MECKNVVKVAPILFIAAVILVGCASVPKKPAETSGVVFQQPVEQTRKTSINALVVLGFDVKKEEGFYIEGYRPRKVGFFVGSGGETVGIWLEPLGQDQTRVLVKTATTLAGRAGQKNWDNEVLAEMEKALGKKQ